MEHITLTAPDISCDHCKHTIEQELSGLPGVQLVSVDVPTKQVNVTYDQQHVSPETIVEKLDEEGYPVAG